MNPPATILAVDDTTESLALLRRILTTAGYEVRLADSGELALAAVAAAPPDLILLDILMPGLDGLEVCRRLKARAETRGIPVILLSAVAGVKEWVEGLQLGAADHIGKPFQPEELLARISTQLALRHAQATAAENIDLRRLNEQLETEVVRRQQAEADLRQSLAASEQLRRAVLSTLEDRQRAEAALRESDANQRALLEAATQSILLIDLDGKVIALNEIAAQRLGRTRAEMLGTSAYDHVSSETATTRRARMAEVVATGQPLRFEDVRSGRAIDQSLVPIRDLSGQVTRVAIFAEDITERRQAADTLAKSESLYHDLVETSQDLIWQCDASGRYSYLNPAWAEVFGYQLDEMLGRPFTDFQTPAQAERDRHEFTRLLQGGVVKGYESVHLAKDGHELHLVFNAKFVRNPQGDITGTRGTAYDVTARKRAEDALRESEERFRMLASLAPVGVYLCDSAGQCTYANPRWCEMAGLSQEAALGDGWKRGLHPEDQALVFANWEHLVASKGKWALEYRFQTSAGRVTWVHGLAAPQHDASGQVTGYIGTNTDITERKQADDQIRQVLAEKEILLKEVHHRVKNNLQVVSGLLDLQAERLSDPQVRLALKESQGRIKSIALVHEILYQSEGLARLDFKAYVQSLVAHLFHAQLGKGRVVRFDLQMPDVTLSVATAVPCGLLINELVTNALKHAFREDTPVGAAETGGAAGPPENKLVLTWEDTGAQWRLTVADNGPGLPAGLDWAHATTLGLRLVQLLTQQLQGTVHLEPGAGCRFVIEFPKP